MIQVNISAADGSPITNGIVADTAAGDSWVATMSQYWPEGFTRSDVEVVDPTAIIQAQTYLAATDWYVIRAMDNGTAMPADIKAKREAARQTINPPAATSTATTGSST